MRVWLYLDMDACHMDDNVFNCQKGIFKRYLEPWGWMWKFPLQKEPK